MGLCTSATALLEFLFNPTVGCLRDGRGRRAAIMMGPASGAVLSLIYAVIREVAASSCVLFLCT